MQQIAKDHHQRITSNLQASYGESATTGYEEPENVQMPEMRKLLGGTPTQQEQPQGSGLITRQPGLGVGQPGGENVLGRTPVGSAVVPRVQVIIDPATGQPTFKRTR
jgi:hypothetical protein